jgi:hypothetical protein
MNKSFKQMIRRQAVHALVGKPDADLAALYAVPTKALNQAVKRNAERFPSDFVFQLLPREMADLRAQFVTAGEQDPKRLCAGLSLPELR